MAGLTGLLISIGSKDLPLGLNGASLIMILLAGYLVYRLNYSGRGVSP